ncbi:unnamed protein product [Coregonus sp. 'balchen']|nr:unnamed protein product [Coregonus sp. 'balchen']
MGEIEGSYRAIQTPGTRLGAQFNAGISTLEPGQSLSDALGTGGKGQGRGLQLRVQGLDDSQEFYNLEVSVPSSLGHPVRVALVFVLSGFGADSSSFSLARIGTQNTGADSSSSSLARSQAQPAPLFASLLHFSALYSNSPCKQGVKG